MQFCIATRPQYLSWSASETPTLYILFTIVFKLLPGSRALSTDKWSCSKIALYLRTLTGGPSTTNREKNVVHGNCYIIIRGLFGFVRRVSYGVRCRTCNLLVKFTPL